MMTEISGRTEEISVEKYGKPITVRRVLDCSFLSEKERRELIETLHKFDITKFDPIGVAEADPRGEKLTKITWPRSPRYRYYGNPTTDERNRRVYDSRGWEVRFCWSTVRNQAGYFLSWVERIPPQGSRSMLGTQRTKWAARKVRKRAAALALRRATVFAADPKTQTGKYQVPNRQTYN